MRRPAGPGTIPYYYVLLRVSSTVGSRFSCRESVWGDFRFGDIRARRSRRPAQCPQRTSRRLEDWRRLCPLTISTLRNRRARRCCFRFRRAERLALASSAPPFRFQYQPLSGRILLLSYNVSYVRYLTCYIVCCKRRACSSEATRCPKQETRCVSFSVTHLALSGHIRSKILLSSFPSPFRQAGRPVRPSTMELQFRHPLLSCIRCLY